MSHVAVVAAAIALAVLLLMSTPSDAAVPNKDYGCYGETSTYIGTLEIRSATKYRYLGEGGKYRAHGKVLRFKSGPLKKWVGRTFKVDSGPAIKLTTDQRGGQTVDCFA